MKVLKFGGSSVATADRIKNIASIIQPRIMAGEQLTVVFSAFGGVTDTLIEMCDIAHNGKNKYLTLYQQFVERHNQAAKELLSEAGYQAMMPDLKNNHETLKDLLKGIYLVREASPRTMDYVLSFGERNANFIIAKYFEEQGIQAEYHQDQ